MLRRLFLICLLMYFSPANADYAAAAAAFNSWNYPKAALEFKPLAEQGDAKAQFYMGYLYDEGKGVPQDDNQAVYWYSKSAAQGIESAKTNLAILKTKLDRLAVNEAPLIDHHKQCLTFDGDLADITATNRCGVPIEARYCFYDDARFTTGDIDKTCRKKGLWTTGLLKPDESIQIFEGVSRPRTVDGAHKAKFYVAICDMSRPQSRCLVPAENPPFTLLGMEGVGQKERAIAKIRADQERKLAEERRAEEVRRGLLTTAGAVLGVVAVSKVLPGSGPSSSTSFSKAAAAFDRSTDLSSKLPGLNTSQTNTGANRYPATNVNQADVSAAEKLDRGNASSNVSETKSTLSTASQNQSWSQCGPGKTCLIGDGLTGFCSGAYDPSKPMCKSECSMDSLAFYHDPTLKPGAYVPGAGKCSKGSCNVVNSCN